MASSSSEKNNLPKTKSQPPQEDEMVGALVNVIIYFHTGNCQNKGKTY